jgi:hypothetical protein
MKRYKLDVEHCQVAGWGLRPIEADDGEWVTWEDHMKSQSVYDREILGLQNEIRRLKTSTITADGGFLKFKDVTECNCAEMLFHECHDGKSIVTEWVCPRHGYKRR